MKNRHNKFVNGIVHWKSKAGKWAREFQNWNFQLVAWVVSQGSEEKAVQISGKGALLAERLRRAES